MLNEIDRRNNVVVMSIPGRYIFSGIRTQMTILRRAPVEISTELPLRIRKKYTKWYTLTSIEKFGIQIKRFRYTSSSISPKSTVLVYFLQTSISARGKYTVSVYCPSIHPTHVQSVRPSPACTYPRYAKSIHDAQEIPYSTVR
jgi:hypothetical protein